MHPAGLAANVLVTLESLVGLLGFALATGILFARFSQPTARILFSDKAVIAPYKERSAFEFRVANIRRNEMIQVEVVVMLTRLKLDGSGNREFIPLKLERDKVVFFPLAWTIVHPIDETSPLHGATAKDLEAWDAEVLILFSGIDEIFSQRVHTRSSYKPDEIVCNARFKNLFNPPRPDGTLSIDIGHLNEIERLPDIGLRDGRDEHGQHGQTRTEGASVFEVRVRPCQSVLVRVLLSSPLDARRRLCILSIWICTVISSSPGRTAGRCTSRSWSRSSRRSPWATGRGGRRSPRSASSRWTFASA